MEDRPLLSRIGAATIAVAACLLFLIWIQQAMAAGLQVGVANPNVTQRNIRSTICKPGWPKTIRPPSGYTTQLKRAQMKARGFKGPLSRYEEDHYIPLECGGHPTARLNLWPQLWLNGACGARVKDKDENACKRAVCTGRMKLAAAQVRFSRKWAHCYVGVQR
jgi:hypothetical protein